MKHCARCGKRLANEQPRVYSTSTRSYYCAEIDACARRAKRARKRERLPKEPLGRYAT